MHARARGRGVCGCEGDVAGPAAPCGVPAAAVLVALGGIRSCSKRTVVRIPSPVFYRTLATATHSGFSTHTVMRCASLMMVRGHATKHPAAQPAGLSRRLQRMRQPQAVAGVALGESISSSMPGAPVQPGAAPLSCRAGSHPQTSRAPRVLRWPGCCQPRAPRGGPSASTGSCSWAPARRAQVIARARS